MGDDLLTDTIERYSIEIPLVAMFYVTEVERQHGRKISTNRTYIATLMDSRVIVIVGFPTDAIDSGIMMTEHIDITV